MSLGTGIRLADLVAAICFIFALRGLTGPKTARYGNLLGASGMALAVGITFATHGLTHFLLIVGAMAIGTVVAVPAARLVKMTAMPQMVAAFNGVGGGAAALIALATFLRAPAGSLAVYEVVEVLLGVVIGCVSFSGSCIAFAKLQELMTGRAITYPGQQVWNATVGVAIFGLGITLCVSSTNWLIAIVVALALAFGVAFVLPVGGADVPVLISLLNSFTGLAVAASGFVLHSVVLVVAGTLVGASGTLLTQKMSQAMGRSLPNILFSAFGSVITATGGAEGDTTRSVRSASAEDVAILLAYANKVIVVPGYGLAVAQAQHTIRELADLLESRGVAGHLRHPPSRRPHAGTHERPFGGGQRPLRAAEGDGRGEPGVPVRRRGPRRRCERRRQPGSQEQPRQPHLRHADPRGRRSPQHRVHEALHAPRFCRHRQRAPLRPEDDPVVRRRQGLLDKGRGRGQGALTVPCTAPPGVRRTYASPLTVIVATTLPGSCCPHKDAAPSTPGPPAGLKKVQHLSCPTSFLQMGTVLPCQ